MPILILLCGIFYAILCIFSIVTGILYFSGKRELNPIELSDSMLKKLSTKETKKSFGIMMGYVTFFVGIVQGIASYSLLFSSNTILYYFAIGFTLFSIYSVVFKLIGRLIAFRC